MVINNHLRLSRHIGKHEGLITNLWAKLLMQFQKKISYLKGLKSVVKFGM